MANLLPITKADFSTKTWQRYPNYLFSASDSVCALSAQELPKAMLSMPLAFVQVGEKFVLVAVQSLQTSTNAYLTVDGQWKGNYIPALYRSYPFVFGLPRLY